jgi:heat-inducible transcriptional repressor
MAELEERGLLSKAHASAGRSPTDRAYRIHVAQLLEQRPRVARAQAEEIDRALGRSRAEVPEMLEEASRQLSSLSKQVGVVLAPDVARVILDRIELVPLNSRRVMVILACRSGVVHHRILEVDSEQAQSDLERIGRYLTENFSGLTLQRTREMLRKRLNEERAALDRLQRLGIELGSRALEAGGDEADLFVEGLSNLLESPEFADRDVTRALFKTLEEKEHLVELLSRLLDGEGLQVVIGEENPLSDLARCSLVASTYGIGGRVIGSVGIVGPTRMEYPRAIALVDHLAGVLSKLLSSPEN